MTEIETGPCSMIDENGTRWVMRRMVTRAPGCVRVWPWSIERASDPLPDLPGNGKEGV